jgi:hypothetical protein
MDEDASSEPSRHRSDRSGGDEPEHAAPPDEPAETGEEAGPARDRRSSGQADWHASLREAGPYIGMGFQLGGTVAFFLGAGYVLDRWLGSVPWGSLLGGVVGIAAALRFVARMNAGASAD